MNAASAPVAGNKMTALSTTTLASLDGVAVDQSSAGACAAIQPLLFAHHSSRRHQEAANSDPDVAPWDVRL
jgi:hypothetical protein